MLLQEREICTLQSVMDANNFSILWTEESWVGNKTLVYIIPTKGIVSIWNKNPQTHNLILLKEKWNNISISDQKKTKTACLGEILNVFCVVTWWVDWQVLSEV